MERYGAGHIHDTYLDGDVIRQRINTAIFPDVDALMANARTVIAHIGAPYTVLDQWVDDEGAAWRAISFVEGTRSPSAVVALADCDAVGRAIGAFHAAVVDLDPAALNVILPSFHDPAARWEHLQQLAAGRDDVHDEIFRLAALAHLGDVAATWCPPNVPVRVAHHDAKADNVLLEIATGEPVAVVDLDTVMPGSWLWDVGDMVRSSTATSPEDEPDGMAMGADRYRAVMTGYLAAAGSLLTTAEVGALADAGPVVTWEQAVRFLTDHLAGDRYYGVARPGQNLERARAQLALVESMVAQRSAMMLTR